MESTALIQNSARFAHRPIQLVLVRANGPLFYSAAAASLLESMGPYFAQRVRAFFRGDKALIEWIESEWLPRKAARAAALRDYVQKTWPEFDWSAAYEQCVASVQTEGGLGPQQPTAAHEALVRCVAAAESGVFYRALASWAEDPRIRDLAAAIARDEALAFERFRAAYERRARVQRLGIVASWRTLTACMRTGRDLHLAGVFSVIGDHCEKHVPFPVIDYSEFLDRMRSVIGRHGRMSAAECLLFRPWKGRPRRVPRETVRAPSVAFRPVLRAAA
jgi:hypothetical protein